MDDAMAVTRPRALKPSIAHYNLRILANVRVRPSPPKSRSGLPTLALPFRFSSLSDYARRLSVQMAVYLARWRRFRRWKFPRTTAPTTTYWQHSFTKARVRVVKGLFGMTRSSHTRLNVSAQVIRDTNTNSGYGVYHPHPNAAPHRSGRGDGLLHEFAPARRVTDDTVLQHPHQGISQ